MLVLLIFIAVSIVIVGALIALVEFEDWLDKALGAPTEELDE